MQFHFILGLQERQLFFLAEDGEGAGDVAADDPPLAVGLGSRIGPSPSSRFAAAPLRFARFAVTAPRRRGQAHENHEPEPRAGVKACE